MVVGLVERTTQNTPLAFLRGSEGFFEHAFILDLMFFLMLLPAIAVFEGTVVTDSAPVFVAWMRRLNQTRRAV